MQHLLAQLPFKRKEWDSKQFGELRFSNRALLVLIIPIVIEQLLAVMVGIYLKLSLG